MSSITISVNGQQLQVAAGTKLTELLTQLNLEPRNILVELNEVALQRHELPLKRVQDGDKIEFIRVVAGG